MKDTKKQVKTAERVFLIFVLTFFLCTGATFAREIDEADMSDAESNVIVFTPPEDHDPSSQPPISHRNAVVAPLTQTRWNQRHSPYVDMIPSIPAFEPRTGCMAAAMAQIMKFHNHPARGTGRSEPYTTRAGINVPSINFAAQVYDWNNMLNTYRRDGGDSNERQRNAAAALMYHVAVSIRMDFGYSGSETTRIPAALVNNFGYDRSIQRHQRIFYGDAEWEVMLKQQLDSGLPVFYWAPYPQGSGHAFVLDGYDNTGRFHFNYGAGGWADGYYFLNALVPEHYQFTDAHTIIINIKPNQGGVSPGFEMALRGFTTDKNTVAQNEPFAVSVNVQNISTLDIFPGGQLGAALVDDNNRITEIVGSGNMNARNPGTWTGSLTINCFVSETARQGQHRLMIVYRPAGGNWSIITKSAIRENVPNAITITVNQATAAAGGGYGLRMTYFQTNKTSVTHNESLNVSVRMRNRGTERFPGGRAGAALVDNNGRIVEIIGTVNIAALDVGELMSSSVRISSTVPNTVNPGRYQLRIVTRAADGEWRIITETLVPDVPVSIDFQVR